MESPTVPTEKMKTIACHSWQTLKVLSVKWRLSGSVSVAGPMCDPLDQYQCKEGVCISIDKVCDGVMDCMFEDDEFDCTDGELCVCVCSMYLMMHFQKRLTDTLILMKIQ